MASKKVAKAASAIDAQASDNTAALAADDGVSVPRLALKETGFVGLKTTSGQILHESNQAFRYPAFHKTIAEMRANPTVGAAMNAYRFLMTRPRWFVKAPIDADDKLIQRTRLVESMMHDMEDGWETFIHSVIPYLEYGYSIHNIVPYRRLKRNGSKYNDGIIGIRKLAIRNQETIAKWVFSDDGRELVKVEQSLAHLENSYKFSSQLNQNGLIDIPRDSFLLFTASATAGNPQGNSIYRNIYLSFKQLTMLQDQQLLSVAKNVQGMLKIEVPAAYLAGDSAPDKGVAATAFKSIIDGYNAGTVRGLLVPQQYDIESKSPMFSYSLMDAKGTPQNNVESIIKGLQNDIAQALSVDVLRLGADGTGSFSLAEAKSSILALAIDARLKEIRGVLNKHLVRFIFESNGWEIDNLPTFEYEAVEEVDLETTSKAIQRIWSSSAIEVDRQTMNYVRTQLGIPLKPDDEEVDVEALPATLTGQATSSGKGLEVGTTGSGTAKNGVNNSGNTSDSNSENKG